MAIIKKYEIDMLNVGAADAFLIHAFTMNEDGTETEYVILVDAGNEGDGEKIFNHIQYYYSQRYIDLVIITHCDADHYGGMKYLVEKHSNQQNLFKIGEVWIQDPYKHVDIDDVKYVRKNETLRDRLNAAYLFNDGSNLLDVLDAAGIYRREVFSGYRRDSLNISVLGPDLDYYESLIPEFRVNLDFKEEQKDEVYNNLVCYGSTEDDFYSKVLEDANDDNSAVNQSSIVFLFEADDHKMIFTGDAGKAALHRIVDRDTKQDLVNISWLKVPHHGSKHNLDNAIISHFHPSCSYISTEKMGKYANQCTINALKKVGCVYSTHKSGSMLHHHNTQIRKEYSTAESL
ncbi:MAG: MBL fold metallo-hydrolase [Prevotella sp.]|nr:MBL fold metallo-hydrolase [Prevotella sp.]